MASSASESDREVRAAAVARRCLAARALRGELTGADLFVDPGWDMLLDLFASSVEGRRISVTSACIASGVPTSTALLWISKLAAKNLIVRRPDPADRRRTFLEITPEASGAVVAWTERLFSPE